MKIYYEVSLEDNMNFFAYQVKKRINPSINDSIKRWNVLCFLLLTIILPIAEYIMINEIRALIYFFLVGLIVFGLMNYKSNLRKIWWNFYKRKARKDLKKMYYVDGKTTRKGCLSIDDSSIVIENEDRKRIYKEKDIQFIAVDEIYYFIFFKDYEGTLVPKRYISKKDGEWFESHI
ncbi:YcxB family protein [Enterococcus sp. LJL120]